MSQNMRILLVAGVVLTVAGVILGFANVDASYVPNCGSAFGAKESFGGGVAGGIQRNACEAAIEQRTILVWCMIAAGVVAVIASLSRPAARPAVAADQE